MNRADRRRNERAAVKAKTKTYNFTREQLDTAIKAGVKKELEAVRKQAAEEAISKAMILSLAFPLYVLRDNYWKKTYTRRLPKFVEQIWEYYEKWQAEELDIDKLKVDLWELGGIKIEESES